MAPGTWGSVPPALIFALLTGSASVTVVGVVMTGLVVLGSVLCVALAPSVIALTGKKDPREVVVDEVAGQAVSFLCVAWLLKTMPVTRIWLVTLAGFLLFRAFDIIKPWPANRLERLPAGWGILADDLMAGLYAGMVLHIGIRMVIG